MGLFSCASRYSRKARRAIMGDGADHKAATATTPTATKTAVADKTAATNSTAGSESQPEEAQQQQQQQQQQQPATTAATDDKALPIIIIGAGPSGLLLAQSLRRRGVAFRLFERDPDFTTRGVGWGLTLNWALPALRELLPDGLGEPDSLRNEACVDRRAVEEGAVSQFPYYDLTTAERITAAPPAPESARVRVTRERLRNLLATSINVEFNKTFVASEDHGDSITARFEDGTSVEGRLVVACDGAKSRLRKALFAQQDEEFKRALPIRMLGVKIDVTPEEIAPLRAMDPFFLHGTNSINNSFGYFSILDAPGNTKDSADKYVLQICLSWLEQPGFMGREEPISIPDTNAGRAALFKELAETWAEPFRVFANKISDAVEIKGLRLMDWVPPEDLRSSGRAVLMGDSLHVMTMFRGDGANHALVDVQDFDRYVSPLLEKSTATTTELREALSQYEATVILRARPGVFASRKAGLDAHNYEAMTMASPLLTPRMRNIEFAETN